MTGLVWVTFLRTFVDSDCLIFLFGMSSTIMFTVTALLKIGLNCFSE